MKNYLILLRDPGTNLPHGVDPIFKKGIMTEIEGPS
jgi:hypothetical protein